MSNAEVARSASWYRVIYRDKSKSGSVAAGSAGADNVVTCAAGHSLWIQRIVVVITTDAAQTIAFQDDAGTPVHVFDIPANGGLGTIFEYDFGPRGFMLTEGKNLDISGTAGPAYNYVIDCYMRQTIGGALSVAAAASAA